MTTTYTIYPRTRGDYVILDVKGAEYRISGQLLAVLDRDFPERPGPHDDVELSQSVPGRADGLKSGNIATYGNDVPMQEVDGNYRFRVAYEDGRRETLELPAYVVHALVYARR